jgi:alpha-beta hydrolase superfamily lysophospholipase
MLHGFGEHIGRYQHVIAAVTASGHPVWGMDLAGHGLSDGSRADVGRLADVLADVGKLVAMATADLGIAPEGSSATAGHTAKPVMFGHSMGGALAAAYAVSRPEDLGAVVLSAPALHVALLPRWQSVATRALAAVAPRAGLTRIDSSQLSHDPDVVRRYDDDPLVWHGKVPARTAVVMYHAGRQAFAGAGRLRLPVLLVHGQEDAIVPVESSRRFFAAVASPDKELRVVPGSWHEAHNEVRGADDVAGIVEWLRSH